MWSPYYLEQQVRQELLRQNNEIEKRVSDLEQNPVSRDVLVEIISEVISDGVDLTNYYTKEQTYSKDEVYTKTEVDDKIAAIDTGGGSEPVDLTNYYTKEETNAAIQQAVSAIIPPDVDLSGYYTKTEVNGLLQDINAKFDSYYTKTETDNKLTDYYTKDETDAAIGSGGGGDVDLSNYYTKQETYSQGQVDTLISGLDFDETDVTALEERVTDIQNTVFYYEGQSQDVIQFIEDNSVVALRFDSEINKLSDTRVKKYLNGVADSGVNVTRPSTTRDAGIDNLSSLNSTATNSVYFPVYYSMDTTYLSTLINKTVAIRLNPSYNLYDPQTGNFRDPHAVLALRLSSVAADGTTNGVQYNFTTDDVKFGQVQFQMPASFTGIYIAFLPHQGSTTHMPEGAVPLRDYIAPGRSLLDPKLIGMWDITEQTTPTT